MNKKSAFTLVEIIIAVAVIGIMASIAVIYTGSTNSAAKQFKFESDIATINQAINNYVGFGGNVSDLKNPAEVLTKLKRSQIGSETTTATGLTGHFIDPRLRAFPLTAEEAASNMIRAVWDPASASFVATTQGYPAVKFFYYSEEEENLPEESRPQFFNYGSQNQWVWDYQDRPPLTKPSPTDIQTNRINEVFPAPTIKPPLDLLPPVFSMIPGSRSISAFPLYLTLSNPNSGGSSFVNYQISSGSWNVYTGPISLNPGDIVTAYSKSTNDQRWLDSPQVGGAYLAIPEPLLAPLISYSSGAFSPDPSNPVTVTIGDPNDLGLGKLFFSLGGGFQEYTGPFQLNSADYQAASAVILAYVDPVTSNYLRSPTASATIAGSATEPEVLAPPVIVFSVDSFSTDAKNLISEIEVTLENPNPEGSSRIFYQLMPVPGELGATTELLPYNGPFTVSQSLYPEGFGIKALAKTEGPSFLDSDFVKRYASNVPGVFGGHLDLDTANFLSNIDNGSTSAHTHDITGKYNLTSIDAFAIPDTKHFDIDEAITDPSTRFKLIVVNGDLSPGIRISIRKSNGVSATLSRMDADLYDDTPLGELPIFSLGGVPGTQKLEGLNIEFDQDVIMEASVIPTVTGDVRGNTPGKGGEWRNGSLTVQAVLVNPDGSDAFTTSQSLSAGGVQGAATSGFLWEVAVYWHWPGPSYDDSGNLYIPRDFATIRSRVRRH